MEEWRRSWNGRTYSLIPALVSASRNVAPYRETSNGVPFVGEQKTRSSSPANAVLARCSKSAVASRFPSATVRSPRLRFRRVDPRSDERLFDPEEGAVGVGEVDRAPPEAEHLAAAKARTDED
jgi:hypothetical protein